MRPWFLAAIAAAVGAVTGCLFKPGQVTDPVQEKVGKTYQNNAELGADLLPYQNARLLLAGTPLSVKLAREQKGAEINFSLIARDEVLEVEHYIVDEHTFRFAGLSDETFVPPMPLARFPFSAGETWDWTGEAGLGKNKKPAKAVMKSTRETVNLSGGVYDCVVVAADLTVTAEGTDSKRTLKFWIQPKKGIVKREFGFSSTREPKSPTGS